MVIELLKSHTSVRSYTEEELSKEVLQNLISAGQHAASSHFVQAYSVIHLTDAGVREKVGEYSKNPHQYNGAGAALVFCTDFTRLEAAAALHGRTIDYSRAEAMLVGAIDVALFAQNVAIAAESQGYGICYIGGIRNNPAEISELLELPEGTVPMFGMTIGVPKKLHEVKPRLPVEAILHENTYNAAQYKTILPEYDATIMNYYETRSANQKHVGWTEQMADFLESPQRPHMKDFLKQQGFYFD